MYTLRKRNNGEQSSCFACWEQSDEGHFVLFLGGCIVNFVLAHSSRNLRGDISIGTGDLSGAAASRYIILMLMY